MMLYAHIVGLLCHIAYNTHIHTHFLKRMTGNKGVSTNIHSAFPVSSSLKILTKLQYGLQVNREWEEKTFLLCFLPKMVYVREV